MCSRNGAAFIDHIEETKAEKYPYGLTLPPLSEFTGPGLPTAAEIQRRVSFPGSGAGQNPVLVATRVDGRGRPGFKAVMTLINVAPTAQSLTLPEEARSAWRLHPVQRGARAADQRVAREAKAVRGVFEVPARSAVVFVVE